MNLKKMSTEFCLAVVTCCSLSTQQLYKIPSTVTYTGEWPIYIYLVDEKIAEIPFTGIQTLTLTSFASHGALPFSYIDISAGI